MIESGNEDFTSQWFQQQSGLEPKDINDAIYFLGKINAIQGLWSEDNPPFNFDIVRLLSEGKIYFHDQKEIEQSINLEGVKEVMPKDKRNVFVVHGRNISARNALFDFLRSIKLNPIEWSEAIKMTGKASPFIGEILDKAFSEAQAVVILLSGDDEARLKQEFQTEDDPPYEKNLTSQARPNVLFEAGMAFGRHDERTIIVQLGSELRPFSDIAGRHIIKINNSPQQRHELAQRLKTAGCAVNTSGTDWLTAGDFEKSIPSSKNSQNKGLSKSSLIDPSHTDFKWT